MQRLFAFVAFVSLVLGSSPALVRADDGNAGGGETDRIQRNIDADATLGAPVPSDYAASIVPGQPFFLLSDASFGAGQVATVRLEAQGEFQSEMQGYGGVDIVVYRVPDPLAFLKAQKNLHRLDIKPNYQGEGLSNALRYLWDRWYTSARRAWQRVLSFDARSQVIQARPEFKLGKQIVAPTSFEPVSRFAPLPGYDLVSRFRYPIWDAKGIEPPKGVDLAGSSSNFIEKSAGNVNIPVGKLQPGLYLVEAIIGNYRAHTLLFVSDTVAAVKSSSDGLFVWTARRDNGKPVPGATVNWTDGVGQLQSGTTDADGALALAHVSPERSYALGVDPAGGVFVSENFYYDSEIYNTKIYAVTDRPLYRPGDTVHVKFIGRAFLSANQSQPAQPATLKLEVIDPNGSPIAARSVKFTSASGGDTAFTLPQEAQGGGYTLRFGYNGDTYGGAFRVAQYVKPHFDVNLVLDKQNYGTNEELTGKIELRYPDGKPVAHGKVSVTLRAQKVAIADGELRYAGLFPVELKQQELTTDDKGNVAITLPAAKDPSRYALTLFAQDGAAYRVRVTREVLIARGMTPYQLTAERSFSQAREPVTFTLVASGDGAAATGAPSDAKSVAPGQRKPAKWEWVHLESQTIGGKGTLPAADKDGRVSFPVTFDEPGSYMLSVQDDAGNLLAATSHWVAGEGLKAVPGSVEIVFDRDKYQIGDTAEALITFPYPVDDALLTLERDKVEARALLSKGADWVTLTQVAPAQWKARIRVVENFAPNMTFSVLYVRDGEYAFANAGIAVPNPAIDLTVKSNKPVYQPGETVTLDLGSALKGKPLPAHLTVSVVDEMIYVLQPEIAPNIMDFFYHPRRNNVRTTSSLSFITYDLALSPVRDASGGPRRGQDNERGVKMLERPRRDDVDTAAWEADLQTDANGHARMTFKMPDGLTRWRITVRAVSADGAVGQRTAYVTSSKALYLKWSGPARFRVGDAPVIDMLAFNQGNADVTAQWIVTGAGFALDKEVTLKPGANYLSLPRTALEQGIVDSSLLMKDKEIDRLQTVVSLAAPGWLTLRELPVKLDVNPATLSLSPDARDVSVRFISGGASQFARVADELIQYPFGCVEQTSSRLIPLALAYDLIGGRDAGVVNASQEAARAIEARLRNQRARLALLAGIDGSFGWWGDATGGNAFMTAYAYYADYLAARSLGITLAAENWQRALDVYRNNAEKESLLHRALALWLLQQMGLPVGTQVSGVADELAKKASGLTDQNAGASQDGHSLYESLVFVWPDSPRGLRTAVVLTAYTARQANARLPQGFDALASRARAALAANPSPLGQSLLAMTDAAKSSIDVNAVLEQTSASHPTVDRALTLLWLRKAMGGAVGAHDAATASSQAAPLASHQKGGEWMSAATPTGARIWKWTGRGLPGALDVGGVYPDVTALVSYRSHAVEDSTLPVKIERVLYRLDPIAPVVTPTGDTNKDKDEGEDEGQEHRRDTGNRNAGEGRSTFEAHKVKPGEAIDSNALYVDEVTLTPMGHSPMQYGVLEAALPPGGSVEGTSWGMSISGLEGAGPQPFKRAATWEMGELRYNQPVPWLGEPVTLRQLVRFALPGTFVLPPARYFRMYQPQEKAYEGGGSDSMTTWRIQ